MENDLSHKIIGACIEVHTFLGGPGLLESVYESALCHEPTLRGMTVQRQISVPVTYKGVVIKDPLYLDILVDKKVIVEIKATEKISEIHDLQILTYLRLTGLKLGLLVNFGKAQVKDGISRIVNNL